MRRFLFIAILSLMFHMCGWSSAYADRIKVRCLTMRQGEAPGTQPLKPAYETYRLRVVNDLYGPVEVSLDGGIRYFLIGRVVHPASTFAEDPKAPLSGRVLHSNGLGLAFSISRNRALKLRPFQPITLISKPKSKQHRSAPTRVPSADSSAIVTNIEPEQGIFAELLPMEQTPVAVQIGTHEPIVFPEDYVPTTEDSYIFSVHVDPPPSKSGDASNTTTKNTRSSTAVSAWNAQLEKRIHELAAAYNSGAVARAKADRRAIVSGNLTLRANLPPDEPEPIEAVTYLIDGDVIAAQNIVPYSYTWDTHNTSDGEHIVEIRAMDRNANPITSVRSLIVVDNSTQDPAPAASNHTPPVSH